VAGGADDGGEDGAAAADGSAPAHPLDAVLDPRVGDRAAEELRLVLLPGEHAAERGAAGAGQHARAVGGVLADTDVVLVRVDRSVRGGEPLGVHDAGDDEISESFPEPELLVVHVLGLGVEAVDGRVLDRAPFGELHRLPIRAQRGCRERVLVAARVERGALLRGEGRVGVGHGRDGCSQQRSTVRVGNSRSPGRPLVHSPPSGEGAAEPIAARPTYS